MTAFLQIRDTDVVFATRQGPVHALRDLRLDVRRGEFVCVIGQPGCGNSTLLQLVAGLLRPARGTLICAGREIAGAGPERALVFQQPTLLPWLTCLENVLLAVESVFGGREPAARLKVRARAALELVGMSHALQKRPADLEPALQQRVAIARALATEPQLLLLDEPFAPLDALTRARLQDELVRLVARTGLTVLMATHDVDEAVLLADRIVRLGDGPAATVADVIDVGIPRPRIRVELADDPRYAAARRAVLDALQRPPAHTAEPA